VRVRRRRRPGARSGGDGGPTKMLVGSRRQVMSTVRYRAVSEDSTGVVSDYDDDDRRRYDDDDYDETGGGAGGAGGGPGDGSYESFGTCDLLMTDDSVTSSRRPPTGTRAVQPVATCRRSPYLRPAIGSRPSDHYFRSVCLSVCLFVQSFSQPSLIRFRSNLDIQGGPAKVRPTYIFDGNI